MTKRLARTLHNGDQVQRKSDGAYLIVTVARERGATVWIEAYEERSGAFALLPHTSVR